MLHYTGHPILDVGIATIVAFANKQRPEELEEADLENIAKYMADNYAIPPLKGFLTVAFPNSGYTQPAYDKNPEKRQIYMERVLKAFRANTPLLEQKDVFMGLPAVDIPLDVDGELEPGRVFRQHVPLLTGNDVINFYPYGDAGLPISGLALLAFQAYPLGSAKCSGRTLLVHSDEPDIMIYFAQKFLAENQSKISLAQAAQDRKMPESGQKYRTLLIHTLSQAYEKKKDAETYEEPHFSVTAYHMSNSGQGVDLDIYHLPSSFIAYLGEMHSVQYRDSWQKIVFAAQEMFVPTKNELTTPADYQPSRNWLYEDLFALAENPQQKAGRFIRTYFLREALRYITDKADPRRTYSPRQQLALISWKLTEPFLRRILFMEQRRIDAIRKLGDALAQYVSTQNDKKFFQNFFLAKRYDDFRNYLLKANNSYVKQGHAPFLNLDNYMIIFEEWEEFARPDWRLARDLVFIRITEQLYTLNWFPQNPDALPDNRDDSTDSQDNN